MQTASRISMRHYKAYCAPKNRTAEQVSGLNTELLGANIELRETQEKLYTLNRQLEERVVKRTDELATANKEQAAINEELTVTNEEMTANNEELTEIQHRLERRARTRHRYSLSNAG